MNPMLKTLAVALLLSFSLSAPALAEEAGSEEAFFGSGWSYGSWTTRDDYREWNWT